MLQHDTRISQEEAEEVSIPNRDLSMLQPISTITAMLVDAGFNP